MHQCSSVTPCPVSGFMLYRSSGEPHCCDADYSSQTDVHSCVIVVTQQWCCVDGFCHFNKSHVNFTSSLRCAVSVLNVKEVWRDVLQRLMNVNEGSGERFWFFTFVAGRSLISSLRLPMVVLQRMTASSLLFTWMGQADDYDVDLQKLFTNPYT